MDRSRERVCFSPACSLGRRAAGLELNNRGDMKEPPFRTVPTFVPCNQHISFLAEQGEKLQPGLGTGSALFSACSGSGGRTKRTLICAPRNLGQQTNDRTFGSRFWFPERQCKRPRPFWLGSITLAPEAGLEPATSKLTASFRRLADHHCYNCKM